MDQYPLFVMIGVVLTQDQISDFKTVIESITTGIATNYIIAYGRTPKDAYSEVKKEFERFEPPPGAEMWN